MWYNFILSHFPIPFHVMLFHFISSRAIQFMLFHLSYLALFYFIYLTIAFYLFYFI